VDYYVSTNALGFSLPFPFLFTICTNGELACRKNNSIVVAYPRPCFVSKHSCYLLPSTFRRTFEPGLQNVDDGPEILVIFKFPELDLGLKVVRTPNQMLSLFTYLGTNQVDHILLLGTVRYRGVKVNVCPLVYVILSMKCQLSH
jgi:hypothetical protein